MLPISPAAADVRDLPVPVSTIYPNVILTADLLAERKFWTTSTSITGIATDINDLIGKETRRRLVAGRPIPLSAMRTAMSVRRGIRVPATYEDAGLLISAALVALQDGATGQTIEARNPETGLTVRALVQADGSLLVSKP